MQGLKPAHETYKRLIWDKECFPDADNIIIGYEDVSLLVFLS